MSRQLSVEPESPPSHRVGWRFVSLYTLAFISTSLVVDKNKIVQIKAALKKYKLTPTNMNTDLFSDAKWKLGGITNANKSIREEALQFALMGCDVATEIGCSTVALWPGSDGWDYNFEVNYGQLLDRFIDGCIAINKKAKSLGLRFGRW